MKKFQAACVQMRSTKSPPENLEMFETFVREAANLGADYVQTPEVTNIVVRNRDEMNAQARSESEDLFVAAGKKNANELNIWLHIGSLVIREGNDKLVNRSVLVSPLGEIVARYDKIHMFDVDLPNGESWRESNSFCAGEEALVVSLPFANLGMTICYDIRFPKLYRSLAHAGATVFSIPAAFTKQTGMAHWHVLQRARAIENGVFVISAAQGGKHEDGRETYGHSLIVDPWGKILAEADGDDPCVILAEINADEVESARNKIPALKNERIISEPRVIEGMNEESKL